MKAKIFKTLKFQMKIKNKFLKETRRDKKNKQNHQRSSKIETEMEKKEKLQSSNKCKEVKINDF